jgi:hypothetical protein
MVSLNPIGQGISMEIRSWTFDIEPNLRDWLHKRQEQLAKKALNVEGPISNDESMDA